MTPELLAKYDVNVPRYTSYPTAPHFTAAVGAERYREWLGEMRSGESLSLYLHIPFCTKRCWYCGCHTSVIDIYEPVAGYIDLVMREIDLVADALPDRHAVSHVHWGGGTPTILRPEDFKAICQRLRGRFDFAAETQIAVEMDPRRITSEIVRALAEAGVTRASLGVQDFRPEVQKAVNRIQPYEVTERVIAWLREAGISDINLDLMYGLPLQTADSIVETVDQAVTLDPQRIALFGYAHVPWMMPHQKLIDERLLPSDTERWQLYTAASGRLVERGYVAIGLDHFARPDTDLARMLDEGRLHRNFQGYTTDRAEVLIGFGASAIGTLPQGYIQNAPPVTAYSEAILGGRLATVRGIEVTDDDRLRRDIIERLMCDLSVDVAPACRDHGVRPDVLAPAFSALSEMADDGLVEIDDTRVRVTPEGRALVRTVCAAFDSYLGTGEARHSRAV